MTDPCCGEPLPIDSLRDWAWETGRTDIVLDLDLHTAAWAFLGRPTRENLVALAGLIPRDGAAGFVPAGLAREARRLALAGGRDDEVARLRAAIAGWCPALCPRVAAGLREMAAAGGAQPGAR